MKKITLLLSLIFLLGCGTGRVIAPPVTLPLPDRAVPTYNSEDYQINIPDPPDVELSLTNLPSEASIAPLRIGQAARMNGVLFNPAAWAFVETQYTTLQRRLVIEHRASQQRLAASAIRDLSHMATDYAAREQEYGIVLRGRDSELTRLYQVANDLNRPNWGNNALWLLGGILFGVAGIGTVYMLAQ